MASIIDQILSEIDKSDIQTELRIICDKMKEQNNEMINSLEESEMLYYNCYFKNEYFKKFLVLSLNPFNDEEYYVDICIINITTEKQTRKQSKKIMASKAKEVLLAYAKILKNLL